jgi:hypothetical protein
MQTVSYCQWRPPQSSQHIEFRASLLDELGIRPDRNCGGLLYGVRHGREVRLLGAGPDPPPAGAPAPQTPPIGIFTYRVRGEVFLTEADLDRLEARHAHVALVISGSRAGFFVRESDGTLQTVRSHEEFPVNSAPRPAATRRPIPKRAAASGWIMLFAMALLAVPLAALGLFPLMPEPLNLEIKERGSQLLLSWNPQAHTEGGYLEIVDGGQRSVIKLLPSQSTATYAIRSGDIAVTLRQNPEKGSAASQTIRVATFAPLRSPAPAPDDGRSTLAALARELQELRRSVSASSLRIDTLTRGIELLSTRAAAREPKVALVESARDRTAKPEP